ncbi:GIY-YIG nuclease family protein [Shouchella miscanthi]|uniref:GIY-YIG nuclease family protein n=1 Tax=Shouchella miscanthi TaxID=2598861 RepID=A0ABU6NJX2_9BACI|nr:GIY-YIG nuclease family protein [Shouchella miscanthi]
MAWLGKLFGNHKTKGQASKQKSLKGLGGLEEIEDKSNTSKDVKTEDEDIAEGLSFNISSDADYETSVYSSPVGVSTGSTATDFYVYEWFIKDTGEIFYVGKGRGDRYKTFHGHGHQAEKIRRNYDTECRLVGTELTEKQAIELESEEMTRVLNNTNYVLTNRITPLFTKRGNGHEISQNTPKPQFETAPCLYASIIDEYYFDIKHRSFDEVRYENLKAVSFIIRNIRDEIKIIYGENLEKYKGETKSLLIKNGNKVLENKYAKSVTAWIYIGDTYLGNYHSDQEKALDKLGRNIPTYHLIDVWKFLIEKFGEVEQDLLKEVIVNPIHNRVPLKEIKNLHDWTKGYDEGISYWEQGERKRKGGNLEQAIILFDRARYNGYNAPVLYKSYAMTYRKLKDYDNEIAIISEGISRFRSEKITVNEQHIIELTVRGEKALALKHKG